MHFLHYFSSSFPFTFLPYPGPHLFHSLLYFLSNHSAVFGSSFFILFHISFPFIYSFIFHLSPFIYTSSFLIIFLPLTGHSSFHFFGSSFLLLFTLHFSSFLNSHPFSFWPAWLRLTQRWPRFKAAWLSSRRTSRGCVSNTSTNYSKNKKFASNSKSWLMT